MANLGYIKIIFRYPSQTTSSTKIINAPNTNVFGSLPQEIDQNLISDVVVGPNTKVIFSFVDNTGKISTAQFVNSSIEPSLNTNIINSLKRIIKNNSYESKQLNIEKDIKSTLPENSNSIPTRVYRLKNIQIEKNTEIKPNSLEHFTSEIESEQVNRHNMRLYAFLLIIIILVAYYVQKNKK